MRVLVTGAAGYIGAAAAGALLAAGHQVRALDSLRYGAAGLLGCYGTSSRAGSGADSGSWGFRLLRGDIRDRHLVNRAVTGVDAVVHLAGIVGDPACAAAPAEAVEVNLDATRALLAAAGRAGVGRFVFASTCSVYGHCDQVADETTPPRPLSLYAETKVDAEPAVLGAGGTVLRFATVYGLAPRMRWDLVVNTMARDAAVGRRLWVAAPAAWRPLIHVGDIAAAITAVLAAPRACVAGQVFNVADAAANVRLGDVARQVADVVAGVCGPGVTVDEQPDGADGRDYRVTGARLTGTTGWTPRRTLRDGIGEIADALANGVFDTLDGADAGLAGGGHAAA